MRKFVALFDMHVGWERGWEGGKLVTKPSFHKKSILATSNFIKDFSPSILILGGDQLNCGPVSHWHKGKPILDAGFRLKDEMDKLDELILTPFNKIEKKIWLGGNHEKWCEDYVEANPGLAGLVEPQNYLNLEKRKWEVFSQGEVATIGKLHFTHGDVILAKGSGTNPAKTLVNAYRRNIRAGHLHTFSVAIEQTAVDARDWHSGIIVPSLSTRNPFWVKNNPNCFVNGFLWGYIYDDGSFSDQVTLINNGVFTINGKKYCQ